MGYLNLVGTFIYKEPLFRAKLAALAANDAQLNTDGWAQNTKTLFFQAAVPTGWTQDASQNNKALRVVGSIGGGGSGGSQGLSNTISLAHTHTVSADDAHTHALANHTHVLLPNNNVFAPVTFTTYVYANTAPASLAPIIGYLLGGGGGPSIKPLSSILATPGALTLSTLAAHDHGGATDSKLTDLNLAYCDIIVGTKNANAGTYTDLTTYWSTGTKIDFDPFATLAANDAYNYGALMPSGSVSIFVQGSAPSGWTKVSGVDDRMLRIVSGAGGGSGGVSGLSNGIPLAHIHNLTPTVDHTHTFPNHQHILLDLSNLSVASILPSSERSVQSDGAGGMVKSQSSGSAVNRTCYIAGTATGGSGTTSAAGGHTHAIPSQLADIQFAYVDVIQCSKNSAGSPYSYTDYTAEFAWKKLVSYQRLNTLAANDAYIEFHTTPSTTGMLFFMASPPIGWNKITTQHDKALRVVAGSSGGIPGGGSQLMSTVITLGHSHTIVAGGGHDHSADHTHTLDTTGVTSFPPTSQYISSLGGSLMVGGFNPGHSTGSPVQPVSGTLLESPVADPDHSHGGVTGSALTDVALAYADVIYCTKT